MPQLFDTICSTDPAVDLPQSRVDRFWVSRDESHLAMRPGATPIRYHLRRVPRSLVRNFIQMAPNEDAKHIRAFMTALVRVDHAPRVSPDGDELGYDEQWVPEWARGVAPAAQCMTENEADRFPHDHVMEIGSVAYQQCFLAPGSDRCYAAPPSLHVALERALSPHVGEMIQILDRNNDAARARLQQLLKSNGDDPTGVDATEKTQDPDTSSIEQSAG